MTKQTETAKKAAVKQALADKYAKMAAASKSRPRQVKLLNKSDRFRMQAADLAR
jgi:hypothetical protein